MPIYLFRDADGAAIEQFFAAKDAPSIGSFITVKGRQYQRVPSFHLPHKDRNRKYPKYPYVSNALPRRQHMAPEHRKLMDFDGRGRPRIKSKSHEATVAKALGMVKT